MPAITPASIATVPSPKDYPAKRHCQNVVKQLGVTEGALYLEGLATPIKGDSDTELPFYQDANFYYLTGAADPDLKFVYDIATGYSTLLVPQHPQEEIIWIGEQELQDRYPVDKVQFTHELEALLTALRPTTIYALTKQQGLQSLSVAMNVLNTTALKECLEEARLFKSPEEVALMRKANNISSAAHKALIQSVHAGTSEGKLYARFVYECSVRGGVWQAYGGIVGRGTHAAILHYTKNDADITDENDVVLVDAGCEFRGYASDITRTFPVGPQFTPKARDIYALVLKMQKVRLGEVNTVLDNIQVGVEWVDLHRLAMKVCAQGLLDLGILQGSLEAIMAQHVPAVFFPHGLGHSIGLNTHDVAGFPKGVTPIDEPGLRNLRMRRKLEVGMVVTVEPGCYFVPALLRLAQANAQQAELINFDLVQEYLSVGGVRIEDSVVVTEDGYINLTTAPKEIEEVEALRADYQSHKKRALDEA
ncbi:hypothetical protein H4R34_003006 [Dimargaris verticillata]|uniref:Aminopeptidase P N-terminal domain-containing protein n=1 Tax=Dimargaris verticillata TaxID=2761393 RepID=A0A9W8B725_9FUNG|nr:hypothetical protein H4R34_003006 [Dimargaris verticillata]